jgi:hypothetical protein
MAETVQTKCKAAAVNLILPSKKKTAPRGPHCGISRPQLPPRHRLPFRSPLPYPKPPLAAAAQMASALANKAACRYVPSKRLTDHGVVPFSCTLRQHAEPTLSCIAGPRLLLAQLAAAPWWCAQMPLAAVRYAALHCSVIWDACLLYTPVMLDVPAESGCRPCAGPIVHAWASQVAAVTHTSSSISSISSCKGVAVVAADLTS